MPEERLSAGSGPAARSRLLWTSDTLNLASERLLFAIETKDEKAAAAGISCLFQFSGTLTDALARRNNANHVLDRLRDAATRGETSLQAHSTSAR